MMPEDLRNDIRRAIRECFPARAEEIDRILTGYLDLPDEMRETLKRESYYPHNKLGGGYTPSECYELAIRWLNQLEQESDLLAGRGKTS